MRILCLTSAFPPEAEGAATHLPEMAEALQQRGHRVHVLAVVNRHEVKDTYPFKVSRISRSQFKPVRNLRIFFTLMKYSRRSQVIYTYGIWWQAALTSILTGTPWVMKFTGDKLWEKAVARDDETVDLKSWDASPKPFFTAFRHILRKWTARATHRVLVSCDQLCQVLLDWGLKRDRIEIIPNALPPNPKDEQEATYLAQWSDTQDQRLLVVGHLEPSKNVDVVLDTLTQVPSSRLVLAGDGPDLERLKSRTRELDLSDRVLFTGKVSRQDVAGYMRECDVLVLSSRVGRFNYVVLEALMQRKPILASHCGLHADFVDHGTTGWLFSPFDSSELAELLKQLREGTLVRDFREVDPPPDWEQTVDLTLDVMELAT